MTREPLVCGPRDGVYLDELGSAELIGLIAEACRMLPLRLAEEKAAEKREVLLAKPPSRGER